MGAQTSTSLDLITGGLRNLKVLAGGEALSSSDAADALQVLNDLLDSLSTDQLFIPYAAENILAWTPGQTQYSLGNPVGGTLVGTLTSGSLAITGVTPVPSGLVAGTTNLFGMGSTVTDFYNVIPSVIPTVITQIGVPITWSAQLGSGVSAGTLGSVNGGAAIWPFATGSESIALSNGQVVSATFTQGSTAVTAFSAATTSIVPAAGNTVSSVLLMSAAATSTPLVNPETITFTTPGNFAIPRPLRINASFTRITASGNTGLDYWFPVGNIKDYIEIGYKGVSGPWPTRAAYQTTYPYGSLRVYPNPSQAGEVHLWTDNVLSNFLTTSQVVSLPQGYARAIKKLLALELAPEYGVEPSMELKRQAYEARNFLRSMNEAPVKELSYDSALRPANSWNDASWITDGGFNR